MYIYIHPDYNGFSIFSNGVQIDTNFPPSPSPALLNWSCFFLIYPTQQSFFSFFEAGFILSTYCMWYLQATPFLNHLKFSQSKALYLHVL